MWRRSEILFHFDNSNNNNNKILNNNIAVEKMCNGFSCGKRQCFFMFQEEFPKMWRQKLEFDDLAISAIASFQF